MAERKRASRRKQPAVAPAVSESPAAEFRAFVLKTLDDKRAEEIIHLDVSAVTDIADEFIIATVVNTRQAATIVEICEKERKRRKLPRLGMEGLDGSSWVVLDYGSLVIHLLTPDARRYYELENLWADAKRLRG